MKFRSLVSFNVQTINRSPRTFWLSVLTITVGVGVLSFLLALSAGTKKYVVDKFFPPEIIAISPGPDGKPLKDEAVKKLKKLPEVEKVFLTMKLHAAIQLLVKFDWQLAEKRLNELTSKSDGKKLSIPGFAKRTMYPPPLPIEGLGVAGEEDLSLPPADNSFLNKGFYDHTAEDQAEKLFCTGDEPKPGHTVCPAGRHCSWDINSCKSTIPISVPVAWMQAYNDMGSKTLRLPPVPEALENEFYGCWSVIGRVNKTNQDASERIFLPVFNNQGDIEIWDSSNKTAPVQVFTLSKHTGIDAKSSLKNPQPQTSLPLDDSSLFHLFKTGENVLVTTHAGVSQLYKLTSKKSLWALPAPKTPLAFVRVSPDRENLVLRMSLDGSGSMIQKDSGKVLFTLLPQPSPVVSVEFSPTDTRFLTLTKDGIAKEWDAKTGTELSSLSDNKTPLLSVSYSPDSKWFIAQTKNGKIKVIDAAQLTSKELEDTSKVTVSQFSLDSTQIATGTDKGVIKIWDTITGRLLSVLDPTTPSPITAVSFSPGKTYLLSVNANGEADEWNFSKDPPLSTRLPVKDVLPGSSFFSKNAQQHSLILNSKAGTPKIYDIISLSTIKIEQNLSAGSRLNDSVIVPFNSWPIEHFAIVGKSLLPSWFALTIPLSYVKRWNRLYKGEEDASIYSQIIVQLKDPKYAGRFSEEVPKLGLAITEGPGKRVIDMLRLLTGLLAIVSVAVSFLASTSIAQTFFRRISERKRELGVIRAVGGTPKDIGLLIYGEALFIGILGGLLGLALAYVAGLTTDLMSQYIFPKLFSQPKSYVYFGGFLVPAMILFGIIVSMIGVFFPARSATKLSPAEVLSSV